MILDNSVILSCKLPQLRTGQQVTLTPWEAVDYMKATLEEANGPIILEK